MLSQRHLLDVCLVNDGTHERCRYLAQDDDDYTKYYCLKKNARGTNIDIQLDEFVAACRKKGKDPHKDKVPMGDNCEGYPILKFINQGYDCP